MTIHASLSTARRLVAQGQAEDAVAIYRDVLFRFPQHLDAQVELGVLLAYLGNAEPAIETLLQAVEQQPGNSSIHNSLGVALQQLGQLDAAAARFQRALELSPRATQTTCNLGKLYLQRNKPKLAVECFQEAITHSPNFLPGRLGLAKARRALGDLTGAEHCLLETLGRSPDSAAANGLLGSIYLEAGNISSAERPLREAIQLAPDSADFQCDLAACLLQLKRPDEAIGEFRRAVALAPGVFRAWYGLGSTQLMRKHQADAVESFGRALLIQPDSRECHFNLGRALCQLGDVDVGIRHFQKAFVAGLTELALDAIAAWVCAAPSAIADDILAAREAFDRTRRHSELRPLRTARPQRPIDSRLHIVYLLSSESIEWHPARDIIPGHATERVDVTFVLASKETPLPSWLPGPTSHRIKDWRDSQYPDLVDRLLQLQVDCLVIVGDYSDCLRTVARSQPARHVIAWPFDATTTGIQTIPCEILPASVVHDGDLRGFSESIFQLPPFLRSSADDVPADDFATLPCHRDAVFTFGSTASQHLINPIAIEKWSAVLQAVSASRLLIANSGMAAECDRHWLTQQFAKHGIDADRVELGEVAPERHRAAFFDAIDLLLDTVPVNAYVAAAEAVGAGVPVLTLCGTRPAARTTASLLDTYGLEDLVAHSHEEYFQMACAFTSPNGRDRLGSIATHLKSSQSSIVTELANELEACFESLARPSFTES